MLDVNDINEPGSHAGDQNAKSGIAGVRLKRPTPQTPHSAEGSEKGGKGGKGGRPPLPPSNAEFLAGVVRDSGSGAHAAICSKPGDPANGGWTATPAGDVDEQCPPTCNNYFNCSTFIADEDGGLRARKDRFSGFHTIVLDDVGTKVAREKLASFNPTWEIETSPGNSQIGVRLAEPLRDPAAVERLQAMIVEAGLSDPGATGVARWGRLPNAINGKARHRDGAGQPFACRVIAWNPDVAYTVDELVVALGLTRKEPERATAGSSTAGGSRRGSGSAGDAVWTPAPSESPVVSALKDRGLYKRQLAPGKHDVTCPWVGEHTDALDTGAAYFEPDIDHATGGFVCQHSHGDRFHLAALLEFLNVKPDHARGKARIWVCQKSIAVLSRAKLGIKRDRARVRINGCPPSRSGIWRAWGSDPAMHGTKSHDTARVYLQVAPCRTEGTLRIARPHQQYFRAVPGLIKALATKVTDGWITFATEARKRRLANGERPMGIRPNLRGRRSLRSAREARLA